MLVAVSPLLRWCTALSSGLLRNLPIVLLFVGLIGPAVAQNQGGNNNQNQGNASGILIDAAGVVAPAIAVDHSQRLNRQAQRAWAQQRLPTELMTTSPQRNVSLVRLEQEIQRRLSQGLKLNDELECLAGLQQIQYVFISEEHQDIVISGPAEPFAPDPQGRRRGIDSGRPTLLLDDWLIAWRHARSAREIGCSIDPRPDNLAALQRYLAQNSSPAAAAVVERRFHQMAEVLGTQDVRYMGVPEQSDFARALLAADYRMKRISQGLEDSGVKALRSHLAMLNGGGNSIQRWWFVPYYDGLYCDASRSTFELTGQRMQLLSQEELSDAAGQRSAAATTRLTTQAFAQQFTQHFPKLAQQSPVFAQLQNLSDWCVLVAILQQEEALNRVNWTAELFSSEDRLPTRIGTAALQVRSVANFKRASGGSMIGLVGGGVHLNPQEFRRKSAWQITENRRLDAIANENLAKRPTSNERWWWDTLSPPGQ